MVDLSIFCRKVKVFQEYDLSFDHKSNTAGSYIDLMVNVWRVEAQWRHNLIVEQWRHVFIVRSQVLCYFCPLSARENMML